MKMSTSCTDIRGEFPLYVGGELEPPTLERVEGHLDQCTACREVLQRAKDARAALVDHFENGEEFGARPSIWPRIRERLREERLISPGVERAGPVPLAPAPSAVGRSRWGGVLRITSLAAAAALLFLLGSLAGRLAVEPDPASPVTNLPGGDEEVIVEGATPVGESLEPVPGGMLRPLLDGERSLAESAVPHTGEPERRRAPVWIPATGSGGNSTATYQTSGTRLPAGVR